MKVGRPKVQKIVVSCCRCGASLTRYPSQIKASKYQRFFCNWGSCLSDARHEGLRRRTAVQSTCEECHGVMQVVPSDKDRRFCKKECLYAWRRRSAKPARPLDRQHNDRVVKVHKNGYVLIYEPTHPNTKKGTWSAGWHVEHRLVVERALGRVLMSNEVVHHINGIKTDNRLENLRVMSATAHKKLHNDEIAAKLRRLEEYERRFGPLVDAQASPVKIEHWLPVTELMLKEVERKRPN